MNATAWSRGLEVTGGGTGVVSHAGLVLLRQLTGITCIRLDATVVPAHSDKEQAQPNFKGFGLLTELAEASFLFRRYEIPAFITVPAHGR